MLSHIPDPAAFEYPAEAVALGRTVTPPSALDRALARTAGVNGLIRCFDPAYHLAGITADRASMSNWNIVTGTGSAAPGSTTIGGKPALQFTKTTSRALLNSVNGPAGSFTAIVVRSQSAPEAATASSVMIGMRGTVLLNLTHARQFGSGMAFLADTTNTKIAQTTRAAGTFIDTFTYDSVSHMGRVLDEDGLTLASFDFGTGPATAAPIWLGGFSVSTYGFAGKIGHALIFDRDMSQHPSDLTAVLGILADYYGIS